MNSSRPQIGLATCLHFVALLSAMLGAFPAPTAAAQVTVRLESGREFSGEVDARTGDAELWLRMGSGSIELLRPVRWERIVEVLYEGRTLPAEAFRELTPTLKTKAPPRQQVRSNLPAKAWIAAALEAEHDPSSNAQRERAWRGQDEPVRMIDIDAYIANWDDDVEVDGLVIDLYPRDARGRMAAVDGTLEVELIAARDGRYGGFPMIGRWTERVTPEEIGPNGARYRFAFQAIHPEFDERTAPVGLVHARLSAPGVGTFEASVGAVRIRPYSAVRDHLEQSRHTRFFPTERTGRPRPAARSQRN